MEQQAWACLRAAFGLWRAWCSPHWSLSSQWPQFGSFQVCQGLVHQRLKCQRHPTAVTRHVLELEKLFCSKFKADWCLSSSASSCWQPLPSFSTFSSKLLGAEFKAQFGMEWASAKSCWGEECLSFSSFTERLDLLWGVRASQWSSEEPYLKSGW